MTTKTYLTRSKGGSIEKRNSQTREYAFAIWTGDQYKHTGYIDPNGEVTAHDDGVIGFSGSRENAEKTRGKWLAVYPGAYVTPAIRVEFEKNDPRHKPKWQATGYTSNGEKAGMGYGRTKTNALDSLALNLGGE